jgi:hypothetical protein
LPGWPAKAVSVGKIADAFETALAQPVEDEP